MRFKLTVPEVSCLYPGSLRQNWRHLQEGDGWLHRMKPWQSKLNIQFCGYCQNQTSQLDAAGQKTKAKGYCICGCDRTLGERHDKWRRHEHQCTVLPSFFLDGYDGWSVMQS